METTPGLFTYEVMGAKSKDLGFAQSRCSCKAQTKDSAMVHGLSAATQQMRRKRTQLAAICIQNKEEEYGQYFLYGRARTDAVMDAKSKRTTCG